MYRGRYDHSVVCLHGGKYLYALGGHLVEIAGRTVERYNVDIDNWELLAISLMQSAVNSALIPLDQS